MIDLPVLPPSRCNKVEVAAHSKFGLATHGSGRVEAAWGIQRPGAKVVGDVRRLSMRQLRQPTAVRPNRATAT